MAISRKPQPSTSSVDDLIDKGGSVPSERSRKSTQAAVPLRLPRPLLDRIDRAVEAQSVPTPRNRWILQAIVEKLERDGMG
jgi:hypothetical protein